MMMTIEEIEQGEIGSSNMLQEQLTNVIDFVR